MKARREGGGGRSFASSADRRSIIKEPLGEWCDGGRRRVSLTSSFSLGLTREIIFSLLLHLFL